LKDFGVAKEYSEKMNYSSKSFMELAAPEFRCLTSFYQLPLELRSGVMPNTP
jgi:hypothetical protein